MAAHTSFCTALKEARSEPMSYSDCISHEPLTQNAVQICANRHFLNFASYEEWLERNNTCPECRAPMLQPPRPAPLQKKIVAHIGETLQPRHLNRRCGYLREAASIAVSKIPTGVVCITTLVAERIIPKIIKVVEPAFEPTWWERNWHGMQSRPAVTIEVEDNSTLWRVAGYALLVSTTMLVLAKVAWNYRSRR